MKGKKPLPDTPTKFQCWLPHSLAIKIELILTDPLRNRVAYGSRSALIERLLRKWLEDVSVAALYNASIASLHNASISAKGANNKEPNVSLPE